MLGAMMFGEVVSQVDSSRGPIDVELFLFNVVVEPVEAHVNMALDLFCWMVELTMPLAVLLSVQMGVRGCGWPNSASVVLIGTASLAFM